MEEIDFGLITLKKKAYFVLSVNIKNIMVTTIHHNVTREDNNKYHLTH